MKEMYLHMKSGKTYQIDPESVVSESGQKVHLDKFDHWAVLTGTVVHATRIDKCFEPATGSLKINVAERKSEIIFSLGNIEIIEIRNSHAE